jgi:hypothetical protein
MGKGRKMAKLLKETFYSIIAINAAGQRNHGRFRCPA